MTEINGNTPESRQLWVPEERLTIPRNQQALGAILPFELIEWVEVSGWPKVEPADPSLHGNRSRGEGEVSIYIEGDMERLTKSKVSKAIFGPDTQRLQPEEFIEEALVRNLVISSLGSVLSISIKSSVDMGPEKFYAADRDMIRLLHAVKTPVLNYRLFGVPGRDFVYEVLLSAKRNNALASDEAEAELFNRYARAVLPVVAGHQAVGRSIARKNGRTVPEELMAPRAAMPKPTRGVGEPPSNEIHQTNGYRTGPRLAELNREYNNGIGSGMVTSSALIIERLDINNLRLFDHLSDPAAAMMVSRIAILAYIEELGHDALAQHAPVRPGVLIGKITQRAAGSYEVEGSSQTDDVNSIKRVFAIANTLSQKDEDFEPIEPRLNNLHKAFDSIRHSLTNRGSQPISETDTTKKLGDHVIQVLAYIARVYC